MNYKRRKKLALDIFQYILLKQIIFGPSIYLGEVTDTYFFLNVHRHVKKVNRMTCDVSLTST